MVRSEEIDDEEDDSAETIEIPQESTEGNEDDSKSDVIQVTESSEETVEEEDEWKRTPAPGVEIAFIFPKNADRSIFSELFGYKKHISFL